MDDLYRTSVIERVRLDFPSLHIIEIETEREAFEAVENRRPDMTLRALVETVQGGILS
ncbi:MAG: hypothetical protein GW949_08505 [Spirochaetales bacterium]|nr:hypothetical protein [Spirochaetales bacterium]